MRIIFTVLLAFVVFSGIARAQSDELEVKVIRIQHQDAGALYPAVSHLNSKRGTTTLHTQSNSLVVRDHPANIKQIEQVLRELDKRLEQVEIKVLVIETTATLLGDLGLSLGRNVIAAENCDDIAYLIEHNEHSDVLSRMSVKTLSGKPAKIQVASEMLLPMVIKSSSQGSTLVTTWDERRPVGDILEVFPRVNKDGTITLTVIPAVGEIEDDGTIYEKSILTRVTVNNGDTIVLGELDVVEDIMEEDGVPNIEASVYREKLSKKRVIMLLTATITD